MKFKKFPVLVTILVVFLVVVFIIGGVNEKIQLQLDPLATILAVMGIGYTWWVDQNYQKSSIEGMLLNEMITRQSFKVEHKINHEKYFCYLFFYEADRTEYDGRKIRFFNKLNGRSYLGYNDLEIPEYFKFNTKAAAVSYVSEYFEIIDVL